MSKASECADGSRPSSAGGQCCTLGGSTRVFFPFVLFLFLYSSVPPRTQSNLPCAFQHTSYPSSFLFLSLLMYIFCMSLFSAFVKLRKATTSFVLSVCLSVYPSAWNDSAVTGQISIKVDMWAFFKTLSRKIQVLFKSDMYNGYFTWSRFHIYDNISLNYY
jgi:hypothetical protein